MKKKTIYFATLTNSAGLCFDLSPSYRSMHSAIKWGMRRGNNYMINIYVSHDNYPYYLFYYLYTPNGTKLYETEDGRYDRVYLKDFRGVKNV